MFYPLDPDPESQNVADPTDPDPKHWKKQSEISLMIDIQRIRISVWKISEQN